MSEVKPRSPNYPAISLEAAVAKVAMLYDNVHEHPVTFPVAAEALGYSVKSSGGIQALAALAAFGLVENIGRGEDRRIKVTKEAVLILHEERSAGRWKQAIKAAAIRPPAHSLLWERFGPSLPPSDAAIRSFLTVDCGFLTAGADQLIREFRDTFAFAELDASLGDDDNAPQLALPEPSQSTVKEPKQAGRPQKDAGVEMLQDTFALPNAEGQVVVEWPTTLSPEALVDIEDWLKIVVRKIKRSVREPNTTAPQSDNQP